MKGYKQTKIGLIPKDWEVVRLGDVFDIDNGKDYRHLSKGNIPVYGTGGCISFVNNYLHDGESVCIGRKGTIDKPIFLTGKFWCIDTLFYTYNFRDVFPKYLYFVFSIINWKKYNEATGVPSLSKKIIKRLLIPLPSLKEQEKIAKILSTWDEAIENQEKLIKEKEKLKKALMQRLLKVDGKKREPKVRFKEFSGEWVEKRLGEILVERKEYATKEDGYVHLSMSKDGIFPKIEQFNRDFLVKDENKKYKVTKRGDICYNPANLKFGVICENDWGDGIFSPIYVTFEVNKSYDKDFIKYIVTSKDFIQKALKYQEGTVYERMAVKPDDLLLMKIFIPPTLKEQEKIADVLSTIDKEIDLLKLELNELKKQKKALMQKLLTGKVRVEV